jgi:hypothetical protein
LAYLCGMPPKAKKPPQELTLVHEWDLPPGAMLGSSVRAKGILQEMRARIGTKSARRLDVRGTVLVLKMAEDEKERFDAAIEIVSKGLVGIETLPVLPREIEDILDIKTSERHRWLKDGRLQSGGTRTVKLRGRARKITFHVFEPGYVTDLQERDMVENWREEDALATAERRRQAAWKAKVKREAKKQKSSELAPEAGRDTETGQKLSGWEDFAAEGFLLD